MASVIIPAHNEEKVLPRLLGRLLPDGPDPRLEVIVAANGCTDATVEVARSFPGVTVLAIPEPGKSAAMRLADASTTVFPRIYLDADVELGVADLVALAEAVSQPGVLAAAPRRTVDCRDSSWLVKAYYGVWQDLPAVRNGIFGRGVVAVSAEGHHRLAGSAGMMSDDLAASAAFSDEERLIVAETSVVVHAPKSWDDLIRRRIRVATGTHQVFASDAEIRTDSRTSPADLLQVARHRPANALRMPVFLAAAVLARRGARRAIAAADYQTWLRDESSRQ